MNAIDPVDWIPLGSHAYRIESTDTFHFRFVGTLDGPTIGQIYDLHREFAAALGRPFFLLVDLSKLAELSVDARKLSTRLDPTGVIAATGVYGGSFHQRTLLNMLTRAGSFLRVGMPPLEFFLHEAEARAFLDACRAHA